MGAQVFADIPSTRETWTLDAATLPRVAVMQGTRPGVTLSGTPGQTKSTTVGPYTISGIPQGDNGQATKDSSVYTTGTFEFEVTGADSNTDNGALVYFVTSDGTLTLTEAGTATDTPFFGVVNFPEGYVQHDAILPVKIGVVN